MKTRTIALLLIAAVLSGLALAQVPAVSAVLAPLSGRDRQNLVDTFHLAGEMDKTNANYFGMVGYPTVQAYFNGRAQAYEQASIMLRDYSPAAIAVQRNPHAVQP